MTLPVIFDRTIKPFILILTFVFLAGFLAGTLAPISVQKEATDTFKYFADSFQGFSGGTQKVPSISQLKRKRGQEKPPNPLN